MAKFSVLILSDGRPGHVTLSKGICAAIARRHELQCQTVEIVRPRWLPGRLASAIINTGGPAARALPRAFSSELAVLAPADLIISAGGDTLAPNIALARRFGCPNIFYGSLRQFRARDFSLVMTSYAANATAPNIAMILKPSPIDPDTLPSAPAAAPVYALLIGGDSGTIHYTQRDWDAVLGLVAAAGEPGSRWLISNSRRTPPSVSDALAALAANNPARVRFVDVRTDGSGTLGEVFARCSAVAVTVDSSSMVSEAVWVRRPVAVLHPARAPLPPLEQDYRRHLAANRWLCDLPLAEATPAALAAALATVTPMTRNPLDDLADVIEARVFAKRVAAAMGTSPQH